jgi:hypothetical protein
MKVIMKIQIALLLLSISVTGNAQSLDWQFVNGRAVAERKIVLSGKSEDEIYKEVSRWLVKYFHNPEENLKAKVHGEYLRGIGHQEELITSGRLHRASLQYTFVADIDDETLTFRLIDGVLIYPGGQDADVNHGSVHKIEEFFGVNDKKSSTENAEIRAALNKFSEALLSSLHESLN